MSSFSNSSSSLSGSTSNPPDGSSGRTFTPSFIGQFGSVTPVFNPDDGTLEGIYDLQGNFYPPSLVPTGGGSRNSVSVLGAAPALVNASSSRAPPPSSMGNMARRGSGSRGLISSGGAQRPRARGPRLDFARSGRTGQNRMMSGVQGSPHVVPMPGSSYPIAGERSQNQGQAMTSLILSSMIGGGPSRSVNAQVSNDQPLQHHQNTSSQYRVSPIGQPLGGVRSSTPTQTKTTTQSADPDPYSMLGLLSVLKSSNPDVTALAAGMDLTTLGLDMTSKENLFETFASPWADEPRKVDPNEFTLPYCYNEKQGPPLHQGMFRRFELKTLFYIFYSMPQDEAQLYAADELYNRDWVFHKGNKCWFLRIGEPLMKTDTYERGTYYCFDPDRFESVQRENTFIYYLMLEKRPSLPQHRA